MLRKKDILKSETALLQQLNKYPGGARTLGLLSFKTAETSKQQPKQQVKL